LILEIQEDKPTIYMVKHTSGYWYDGLPEVTWGWHDIKKLSEIIDPQAKNRVTSISNLLFEFADLQNKSFSLTRLFKKRPKSMHGLAFLIPDHQIAPKCYHIEWHTHEELFKKTCLNCTHVIDQILIHVINNEIVFVPAGWGLAVIEEVKKRKNQKVVCIDKSKSMLNN